MSYSRSNEINTGFRGGDRPTISEGILSSGKIRSAPLDKPIQKAPFIIKPIKSETIIQTPLTKSPYRSLNSYEEFKQIVKKADTKLFDDFFMKNTGITQHSNIYIRYDEKKNNLTLNNVVDKCSYVMSDVDISNIMSQTTIRDKVFTPVLRPKSVIDFVISDPSKPVQTHALPGDKIATVIRNKMTKFISMYDTPYDAVQIKKICVLLDLFA